MCPLREAFSTWAGSLHAAADPAGCIHEKRPISSECLSAKGFPADTPFNNDSDGFRCAGNAVPPSYFKELFPAVTDVLDRAEVPLVLPRKPDEYITYAKHPLHPNDVDITASHKTAGKPAKKGQNVCHRLTRDKLTNVPVTAEELKLMSDQLVGFSGARLADGSKRDADMGWAHWLSCAHASTSPSFSTPRPSLRGLQPQRRLSSSCVTKQLALTRRQRLLLRNCGL
jgi:hypothetical protein